METIVAAFGGAILGAILTGIINLINNDKLYEMNKFETSARKFRATVLSVFEGVYPTSTGSVLHPDQHFIQKVARLSQKWPKLLRAYTEFYIFVSDKKEFEKLFLKLLALCRDDVGERDIMIKLLDKNNYTEKDGFEELDKTIQGFLSYAMWENSSYNKTEAVIRLGHRILGLKQ